MLRAAAALDPAAADDGRGARGDARAQRRRAARRRAAGAAAAVPRAAPLHLRRRDWSAAAACRLPGEVSLAHARRAVPRRAVGVLAARARGAAPAAGGGLRADHAQPAHGELPGRVHAGRGDQSVPVRLPRRPAAGHAAAPRGVDRQEAKLSGPLLDRIDMILRVEPPSREELMSGRAGEASRAIRERVVAARALQASAPAGTGVHSQRRDDARADRASLPADGGGATSARMHAHERVGLSMRGHDRVLRVARTLADLDGVRDPWIAEHVVAGGGVPGAAPAGRAAAGGRRVSACDACLRRAALSRAAGALADERVFGAHGGCPRCSRSATTS